MTSTLEQTSTAIRNWNNTRHDSPLMVDYFNKGDYFIISRDNYDNWKNQWHNLGKPDHYTLHAYLGCNNSNSISLYIIDNYTDRKPVKDYQEDFNKKIQIVPYIKHELKNPFFNNTTNGSSSIDPLLALQNSVQWILHKDNWIKEQTNMVQVLVIPFEGLTRLIEQQQVQMILCLPALKFYNHQRVEMDMILWGYDYENGIIGQQPEDLIQPVPPYSQVNPTTDFQLLQYTI